MIRLLFFYVFAIFVISVLVPYTEPNLLNGSGTATASPFVIAIENAGIKALLLSMPCSLFLLGRLVTLISMLLLEPCTLLRSSDRCLVSFDDATKGVFLSGVL